MDERWGVFLLTTAQTVVSVPHASWGAELTPDHHDRTRVFTGKMVCDVSGFLLAAGALFLLERSGDPRATARVLAWAAAALAIPLVLAPVFGIREPAAHQGRGGAGSYAAFRDVVRNPHARVLVSVFFLESLGFTVMITTMPFAMQYSLGMAGATSILLAGAVVVQIGTVPAWLGLSRRLGKRNVWLTTQCLRSLAFGAVVFLPPESWLLMGVSVTVIGSAYTAGQILGPSLKADVIDYDELRTGERKEGAYFASWNLAQKAGAGAAVALAGFPCVFYALAAALLWRLQLDERGHREVQAALAARASAADEVL